MNPRYKSGVLLFGVILPAAVLTVAVVLIFSQKSKFEKQYEIRKATYQSNLRSKQQEHSVRAQLKTYHKRRQSWEDLLANSDVGSVTGLLKNILASYNGTEKLRQNYFKFDNKGRGVGASSSHPSVTYSISLSGTFSAIQESLLLMESEMPNLCLNSINLKPKEDSTSSLLEANLSYSAWTK